MELKFFICEYCGNIITMVDDKKVPVFCCGQKMTPLVAGSKDAAVEKHVPEFTVNGNSVHVEAGSTLHPMTEEHLTQWIAIATKNGCQIKKLTAKDEPKADFTLADGDELVKVYAYCNLHGLWEAE